MGMLIPAGSIATVQLTDVQTVPNTIGGSLDSNDVMDAVAAELSAEGFVVLQSSNSGGFGILGYISGMSFSITYQLQVSGMTDTDTLISIVQQAVGSVTNAPAGAVTIPNYTTPQQGSQVNIPGVGLQAITTASQTLSTGQPQAAPTTSQSIGDAIAKFFASLGTTATYLLYGLAALIVLVLVLAAYGPNVGSIAAAVA